MYILYNVDTGEILEVGLKGHMVMAGNALRNDAMQLNIEQFDEPADFSKDTYKVSNGSLVKL